MGEGMAKHSKDTRGVLAAIAHDAERRRQWWRAARFVRSKEQSDADEAVQQLEAHEREVMEQWWSYWRHQWNKSGVG